MWKKTGVWIAVLVVALIVAVLAVVGSGALSARHSAASQVSPAAGTAAAVVYTCPMHPEVVSSQPGNCPKCGMNLVMKPK